MPRPPDHLASADNFRDIAGPGKGCLTATGRMRRGQVFRSSQLTLPPEDVDRLVDMGVAAIHDLRPSDEHGRVDDVVVPGALWRHHPVPGIPMDEVAHCARADQAGAVMARGYRQFVASPSIRETLGRLLTEMAATPGPQIFHCASGKDRTGWLAMLLQHIAGVTHETLIEDYLRSNGLAEVYRRHAEAVIIDQWGPERLEVYEPSLVARRNYLEAGIDEAVRRYGDLDGYLAAGLGLSGHDRQRLHRRLNVEAPARPANSRVLDGSAQMV
jgi:protein-tyrosine phosphatase